MGVDKAKRIRAIFETWLKRLLPPQSAQAGNLASRPKNSRMLLLLLLQLKWQMLIKILVSESYGLTWKCICVQSSYTEQAHVSNPYKIQRNRFTRCSVSIPYCCLCATVQSVKHSDFRRNCLSSLEKWTKQDVASQMFFGQFCIKNIWKV